MSTEAAKWRTTTTTGGGMIVNCHRLEEPVEGVEIALWQIDEDGRVDASASVRAHEDPVREGGGLGLAALKVETAAACRRLAARLLETAEMIAPGTGCPIPVLAAPVHGLPGRLVQDELFPRLDVHMSRGPQAGTECNTLGGRPGPRVEWPNVHAVTCLDCLRNLAAVKTPASGAPSESR